LESLKNRRI